MTTNPNPTPNLSASQPITQGPGLPTPYFQGIWRAWTSYIQTAIVALVPLPANPTASAGPTAVDGTAKTFMRSDAAPAVQLGSATQKGLVQADGVTITAAGGVLTSVAGGSMGANPTALVGPVAIDGTALTFMRSDAAPGLASIVAMVESAGTSTDYGHVTDAQNGSQDEGLITDLSTLYSSDEGLVI